MALLDRLKERIDTDLSNDELTSLLASANALIERRYGTDGESRTVYWTHPDGLAGREPAKIVLPEPANTITSVTEDDVVLASSKYRLEAGGRILARLDDSVPAHVDDWGERVTIVYVAKTDTALRDEAAIQLAILQIQFDGNNNSSIGDASATKLSIHEHQLRILATLDPANGMGML